MPAAESAAALIAELRAACDPAHIASQQRFGSRPRNEQLGGTIPQLRALARAHRRDHPLAVALWSLPVHEAHILAGLVAVPASSPRSKWTPGLRASTVGTSATRCASTPSATRHTPSPKFAPGRAREPEFERRAAFALLATLAVHKKQEPDTTFLDLVPLIEQAATDERNFVKKAVNWALRQIGKRRSSPACQTAALALAEKLASHPTSPSARWIGKDADRELRAR
jgi:3-methyladenine DNA glycosylase AlkD